jgi:hypothetical protein
MSGNGHCYRLRRIRFEFMKIAARKTTAASKASPFEERGFLNIEEARDH